MFCGACGAKNETAGKFCHACGNPMSGAAPSAPAPPPVDPGTMRGVGTAVPVRAVTGKNPVLAAVLSAVIVGLGQFYNGDAKKGAAMLIGGIVLGAVSAGLLWLVIAIWSAVDAYKVASGTGHPW